MDLLRRQAGLHVSVGRAHEIAQGQVVYRSGCIDLDVAHKAPGTFQKARGIVQAGAEEESHIHMRAERVDVPEGQFPDAGGRMAIMKQFKYLGSGLAHLLEPSPRNSTEFRRLRVEPSIDLWVTPLTTGQREQSRFSHGGWCDCAPDAPSSQCLARRSNPEIGDRHPERSL
jgi:hypothetical protein